MSNTTITPVQAGALPAPDAQGAGTAPGGTPAEPAAPTTAEPSTTETRQLADRLAGSSIDAVFLVEARDFQAQRRDARAEQMRNRRAALAQAQSEHRHRVKQAEDTRHAAIVGAVVSGFSAALSYGTAGSSYQQMAQAATQILEKLDGAIGYGASAAREGIAAELAAARGELVGKEEADAADRAQALRESQAKVLDLLQETMRGQSESRAAATRA
jgi:hypothetical protein